MGVNNLPKVIARQRGGRGSNSRPLSHQSDTLATRLSSHRVEEVQMEKEMDSETVNPVVNPGSPGTWLWIVAVTEL